MGNYNITIEGVGCHHNSPERDDDANKMASDFVRELEAKGHTISKATITFGAMEDLSEIPVESEEERILIDQEWEESKRLHREYTALVLAQRAGAKNGAAVVRLTDECSAKGIVLVTGGEFAPRPVKRYSSR